jgi:CRISP-associated protein Cas1
MKSYYILSNGRVMRKDNTLYIENAAGEKKPIPVEDVDSLYLYGEIDINTKLLTFLGQKKIPLHVFNYYGFYSGSYYPREYLHSGYLLVHQVRCYTETARRLALSQELVRASAHSMLRNVAYYSSRKAPLGDTEPAGEVGVEMAVPPSNVPTSAETEEVVDAALESDVVVGDIEPDPFSSQVDFNEAPAPLSAIRATIEGLAALIDTQSTVDAVRGVEGKMRERYYKAWPHILSAGWAFSQRVRRPPDNEVNALISFGNSVLYTACLSELYRTQLTPTISYLHEPGARRFSLALDMSEIFKPLIVDRAIFRLINTNQLKPEHFDRSLDGCYLADAGRRLFLTALEERLSATIHHRRLGRHVSYRHLIRLECYKLIRHLTGVEAYRAFRAWW